MCALSVPTREYPAVGWIEPLDSLAKLLNSEEVLPMAIATA